jgi:8-oxo-dGTP diphosphatase
LINITGLDKSRITPLTLTFLIEGDNVLTLHRSKEKTIYPDRVNGFGGKVEPNEDLFNAAKREFKEETGLEVKNIELRGTFIRILTEKYFSLIYLFIANGYEGRIESDEKEGKVAWVSIDEFLNYPKLVDHVKYYFKQIVEGKDFYSGVGYYKDEELLSYQDSKDYFISRKAK